MISHEQRQNGLMSAEKFSLPVDEITKRIVETYRYILILLTFKNFDLL